MEPVFDSDHFEMRLTHFIHTVAKHGGREVDKLVGLAWDLSFHLNSERGGVYPHSMELVKDVLQEAGVTLFETSEDCETVGPEQVYEETVEACNKFRKEGMKVFSWGAGIGNGLLFAPSEAYLKMAVQDCVNVITGLYRDDGFDVPLMKSVAEPDELPNINFCPD